MPVVIGRASWRHLVNVISWSERASLFIFPKHTHNKRAHTRFGNVGYRQHPLDGLTIKIGGRLSSALWLGLDVSHIGS